MLEQTIRLLILAGTAFTVALILTPVFIKILDRFHLHKQIRSQELAPVFYSLHKHKENTPTMGGVIIWVTVLGLALLLWVLS
ncbi:MAG: hypothetical protein AAB621_01355, partial [Patescibacteria group bacterium]